MENKNPIADVLNSSLENLKKLVDVNTIVGTPIVQDGVTLIPISKVTFGYGSGGSEIPSDKAKLPFGGGSGGGVSIIPVAFVVISNGKTEIIQISAPNSTADRIVNMIPGMFDKVSELITNNKNKSSDAEAKSEKAE